MSILPAPAWLVCLGRVFRSARCCKVYSSFTQWRAPDLQCAMLQVYASSQSPQGAKPWGQPWNLPSALMANTLAQVCSLHNCHHLLQLDMSFLSGPHCGRLVAPAFSVCQACSAIMHLLVY